MSLLPKSFSLKNLLFLIALILFSSTVFTGCSNLDIEILNNKAAELMQKGDIDGAIARLESIQDLNPNFPQTNYNLGVAYKEKGEYDKALKYLNRSIKLKPDLYQAHLTVAVINEELAENLLAKESVNTSNDKDPSTVDFEDTNFAEEKQSKLYTYYKTAKISLEEYLKYAPKVENKNFIEQKIAEFDKKIAEYQPSEAMTEVTEQEEQEEQELQG